MLSKKTAILSTCHLMWSGVEKEPAPFGSRRRVINGGMVVDATSRSLRN